jgi:hypothetical protein
LCLGGGAVCDLLDSVLLLALAVRPQTDLVEVLEFLGRGGAGQGVEEVVVDVEFVALVLGFVEDTLRVGCEVTCVCLGNCQLNAVCIGVAGVP